jgi:hypothetical protein
VAGGDGGGAACEPVSAVLITSLPPSSLTL